MMQNVESFSKHKVLSTKLRVLIDHNNARVKQKHRHLLEVARALMLQSGLHLSFWGESVLTAAFIINRLPSFVLNNRCPYELLYDKPVDYTKLKSFGCLAFAINLVHNSDKLAPRGVPCVFIGYPPTQNGFRLLDLKTMKLFVSRDVSFNDSVFPLNSTQPKPCRLPLPTEMPDNKVNIYIHDDFLIIDSSEQLMNHTELNSPTTTDLSASTVFDSFSYSEHNQITPTRRSTRTHKPPLWMESYITHPFLQSSANLVTVTTHYVEPIFSCFLSSLVTHKDPSHFKKVVTNINWLGP